jgi:LmbE family N-acetylglucosaminyl deacetylase
MDPDPVQGRLPYSRKKLVEIRKSEQRESARVLGYDLLWLGLPDLTGKNKEKASRLIGTVLERARPEILVVPAPDIHPTHQRAYHACLKAARLHPVREILFYGVWDIYEGSGTTLNQDRLERVEVTIPQSLLELKKSALFAHQSQMDRPVIQKLYTDLVSTGRFSIERYARLTMNYAATRIPKAKN